MARKIILVFLLWLGSAWCLAVPAFASENREAEFTRQHLNVEPPAGWVKEEVPLSDFQNCIGYRQQKEGIVLMVCPVVGEGFEEILAAVRKEKLSGNVGKCVVLHGVTQPVETLLVPLKKRGGGAFIKIASTISLSDYHELLITVNKNGVVMPAFIPKLLQQAGPMLSAFKDLAVPSNLSDLHPVVNAKDEELVERFAASQNWKLDLPQGWIQRPPTVQVTCLDHGMPLTCADYLNMSKYSGVCITVCPSTKSAEEIAKTLYSKLKHRQKDSSDSGKYLYEAVERNGSWVLEQSNGQRKSIYYITSNNTLYSLIHIIGYRGGSLEPGKELLKKLQPDDPTLFPRSY